LVELENVRVNGGQNALKSQIFDEGILVAIESREGITDVCISRKKCFEYFTMMTCKLEET
jgi:hypothetical protein